MTTRRSKTETKTGTKTEAEGESRRTRRSLLSSTVLDKPEKETIEPAVNNHASDSRGEKTALKDFLKENGYKYIRGIYVGEVDHGVLTYAKASVLGIKVYIDLDTTYTDIRASAEDLGVKRTTHAADDTVSNNEKAERCASMDVCGTLWECKSAFCTERRNEKTLELEEDAFHVANGSSTFERDETAARPIVRISDIIKDNIATVFNIQSAAQRNKAKAKKKYLERKLILKTAAERLYNLTLDLDETLEDTIDNVDRTIKQQTAKGDDLEFPPAFHQTGQFDSQMDELEKLNDMREMLIGPTGVIDDYIKIIDDITYELEEMHKDVSDIYG